MLRRRPDNTFEFREIERMLYSARPPALAPDRRDALRLRIMASLGDQDPARIDYIAAFRERWVAVPIGAGIAAAVIAGVVYLDTGEPTNRASVTGDALVGGIPVSYANPGEEITARGATWVAITRQLRVGMDAGATFQYEQSDDSFTVYPGRGNLTLVSGVRNTDVVGHGWSGVLSGNSVAQIYRLGGVTRISAIEGLFQVTVNGLRHDLIPGSPDLFIFPPHGSPVPPPPFQSSTDGSGAPAPGTDIAPPFADEDDRPGNAGGTTPPGVVPTDTSTTPPGDSAPPANPDPPAPPSNPGNGNGQPTNPGGGDTPAPDDSSPDVVPPSGNGNPPADPGIGNGPPVDPGPGIGNGPPEDPGTGIGNGPPESPGSGNGTPGVPASENGNGPGTNSGGGNAHGPGSNSAGGNGNGPGTNSGLGQQQQDQVEAIPAATEAPGPAQSSPSETASANGNSHANATPSGNNNGNGPGSNNGQGNGAHGQGNGNSNGNGPGSNNAGGNGNGKAK